MKQREGDKLISTSLKHTNQIFERSTHFNMEEEEQICLETNWPPFWASTAPHIRLIIVPSVIMNQNCNCYEWCQRGSCWTWRSPHHRTRVPHHFSPGHRFTPHLSCVIVSKWKTTVHSERLLHSKAKTEQMCLFFITDSKSTQMCFLQKEYFQSIGRTNSLVSLFLSTTL